MHVPQRAPPLAASAVPRRLPGSSPSSARTGRATSPARSSISTAAVRAAFEPRASEDTVARKSLRQRAMSGEAVLGAMVFEFFTPGISQVLKLAGCEYLIY